MRTLLQDFHYGARVLIKSPGYSLVVIVTMALALGANTVIFSFANVLLVKPLPVADPDTLGWIYSVDPHSMNPRGRSSYLDYLAWRDGVRSFATLAAVSRDTVTMSGRGDPQRVQAQRLTGNLFATWGLKPAIGRLPAEDEIAPGRPCVGVLSHRFWSTHFDRSRAVLSQALTIDGQPCTVVGVMSPDIEIGNLSLIDIWMPLAADVAASPRQQRVYSITGRLAPGATHEQAGAEVRAIAERLQREFPGTNAGWTGRVVTTNIALVGESSWLVLALLALTVSLVLVIACANVSNLMLARAGARRRELAVRAALGATRWRVVRQLVTESLLLGMAGGALALGVARGSLAIISAAAYEPFFHLIEIDRNVILFAGVLAFLAPLLFSLLPAIHSSAADVGDALKEGARSGGSVRARRSRHALVVAQVGMALMLLVVSMLLVRTMLQVSRIDPGFDPGPLLIAELEVPEWRYPTLDDVARFHERLLADVRRIPGARSAAAVTGLPTLSFGARERFSIAGRPEPSPADRPWAQRFAASDGYFETAGIPLLRGRTFTTEDRAGGARVAIVNAEAVRRYWKTADAALGASIAIGEATAAPEWLRIVGVVRNTANPDPEAAPDPSVFVPLSQQPARAVALVVRAAEPQPLAPAMRAAVRTADPELAVFQLRTMNDAMADELSTTNILTWMFAAFAALALVLATTGLYGVIAYSVGQRRQEIGVRLALGARPGDIRRLVVGQALRLVVIGSAFGLAGAAMVARTIGSLLYGVTPFDPATYGGVLALVAAAGAAASYVPARRASRLDPVTNLRAE